MPALPYRFTPTSGYDEYKISTLLKDYMESLPDNAGSLETKENIVSLINGYSEQLSKFSEQNKIATTREVYRVIDHFFEEAPQDMKKEIQCKAGCTACCYIEIDVTENESETILEYCRENKINADRDYLEKQAEIGRESFSAYSRCVFLEENLCQVYPVRPVACRKHFVMSDPSLCDFSENRVNQVAKYFDINTEILASAFLHTARSRPFAKALLFEGNRSNYFTEQSPQNPL